MSGYCKEQSLERKEIVPEDDTFFEDAISSMCSEYLAWQSYTMGLHHIAPPCWLLKN